MKKFTNYLMLLGCIMMMSSLSLQSQISSYDKDCADYWIGKMNDPDVNFTLLVNEFNQYWEGKTPGKNSGYKQFRRWQHFMENYVKPDGYLLPPDHDQQEYKKFMQQNPGDEIVGTWSLVGPTVFPQQYYGNQCPGLGRISALAFHPTNPNILFAGAPVGGLWKSVDGGDNWTNLNTDHINTMGVSAIAIDYTDPDIIYIGTGDRDGGMSWGLGVYKSVDGGLTWAQKNTGLGNKVMSRLLIYPDNHNNLIAAAGNGIYVSSNAGENWTKVYTAESTIKDIVFKPGNSYYIYACDQGALYRSTTYGLEWSAMFSTDNHRMAIAVTPANPEKLYVISTKNSVFGALFVSSNSGANFTQYNSTGLSNEGQGGYNLDLAVDPTNENTVYVGMVNVFKSTNGGSSFTQILNAGQIHADQHVFEFSPHTSDYMFIGNDGGVYKVLVAGGANTVTQISDGLAISQVYRLSTCSTFPDLMISGMQDCGSYITSSNPWLHRLGGDGMNCQIDYNSPTIMYGSSQCGNISRSTNGGNSFSGIAADGVNGINQSGDWLSAFVLDQFSSSIMFAGFKDVWRSVNVNTINPDNVSWTNISEGQLSGEDIMVMEQSPVDGNYMFVADAGGNRLFMTADAYDASPTWTELAKPYAHKVSWIEAHPTDKNIFYFTIVDVVYRYNILTQTWDDLTGNFPWIAKLCIVYQENSDEGLYVGTATGVFYKNAEMDEWVVYKSDLPTTHVYDMEINYHTDPPQLFVATFGRGIWKTDVYPSPKPNLVASGISSQVAGTMVEMVIGYQNQSVIASAEPFKIGYYLSVNNIIGPGDYLIGEENEPEAAPMLIGQGHLQSMDVALVTPEIPSGTFYMGAYLDYENVVNELSETDNRVTASQQVTIPAQPSAPTNVQATDGTITNCINISWTAPAGGTYYYRVFRNTTNDPAGGVNVSGSEFIGTTSFNDYGAPRGLDVYYWVKASAYTQGYRASDYSASNAGWFPVLPPSNVQATDGQFSTRVTITWSPPVNATHYRVFRSTVNNPALSTNISGTSWITTEYFHDLTAVAGTTYYYWVKAARSLSGARASDYSTGNSGWVAFASAPDAIASDGTYTDKVAVTWNSVAGASYYKVYRNTVINPETSSAMTVWQIPTTYDDVSALAGTNYYYWIKASNDNAGTLQTGYGLVDSGWKNFAPPASLTATDGTLIEQTDLIWSASSGASRYKVYRHTQANFANASPVSYWINTLSFSDHSSVPGLTHFYWVVAAGDTILGQSQPTSSESGWCLLNAPDVSASKGLYNDHVHVTWTDVNGGIAYRVYRSLISNSVADPLTAWSTTLNFQYDDYTAVQGEQYRYYVKAARNTYGLRESDFGDDIGFADECGNMIDDVAHRSVYLHGSTLEITQRIINEGPYALLNQGQIAFALENTPFGFSDYMIGYVDIPPLNVGEYYDVNFTADLNAASPAPVEYGTWYVTCYTSWDFANCDANQDDDYVIWESMPFEYTDALYGEHSVGPVSGEFYSMEKVLEALADRGISDQVIFNLEPEIYNEQLVFSGVEGCTPAHNIVFRTDPAFKSDTAEIICSPSNIDNYTLKFLDCANIRFENLKLSTYGFSNYQSTYGHVIEFSGSCSNIAFVNNSITGFTDDAFTGEDNAVIIGENSALSEISIIGNTIRNGSIAILFEGINNISPVENLVTEDNSILDFMESGIELVDCDHIEIIHNQIMSLPGSAQNYRGIRIERVRNGLIVTENNIVLNTTSPSLTGILIMETNLDGNQRGLIANNMVSLTGSATNMYALNVFNVFKTDIYYNSIHISGTHENFSTSVLLDCPTGPITSYDNKMKNNIISNQAGGYCLLLNENAVNYQYLSSSDFNDFISSGQYLFFYKTAFQLSTIPEWTNATGFDGNSISVDPAFYSDSDLHSNSPVLDGAVYPLAEVVRDIDGNIRDAVHTDTGADEFTYIQPVINLDVKVWLEGPFNNTDMTTNLTGLTNFPLTQPYNISPWNYPGTENVTSVPANVVDWILVELRDAPTAAQATSDTRIASQAAFLKKDGSIVGMNGTSLLQYSNSVTHQLFVVICHRNHIPIMSAVPLVKVGDTYSYDFRTDVTQAYGNGIGYKDWGAGVALMVAADGNSDGATTNLDKTAVWTPQAARKGFFGGDFNLDTQVNNIDKDSYWWPNRDEGFISQVPE